MTVLQRFGFKTRKDGSEVYRDAEKVNQLSNPLSAEVGLVAIQLRRWCWRCPSFQVEGPSQTAADASALFIFDWLADRT